MIISSNGIIKQLDYRCVMLSIIIALLSFQDCEKTAAGFGRLHFCWTGVSRPRGAEPLHVRCPGGGLVEDDGPKKEIHVLTFSGGAPPV